MANTTGKKFGGRQKGTPNKLTSELRAVLKDLIHEELETLQERMEYLDTKERLDVLVKLLPYILPKCTHTTAEINVPRKPPSWFTDSDYPSND